MAFRFTPGCCCNRPPPNCSLFLDISGVVAGRSHPIHYWYQCYIPGGYWELWAQTDCDGLLGTAFAWTGGTDIFDCLVIDTNCPLPVPPPPDWPQAWPYDCNLANEGIHYNAHFCCQKTPAENPNCVNCPWCDSINATYSLVGMVETETSYRSQVNPAFACYGDYGWVDWIRDGTNWLVRLSIFRAGTQETHSWEIWEGTISQAVECENIDLTLQRVGGDGTADPENCYKCLACDWSAATVRIYSPP